MREGRNSRFGVNWSNPEMVQVPCHGSGVDRYNLRHKESSLSGQIERDRDWTMER